MNAQQAQATYLKSKAKMDSGKGTKMDEFIVDLWVASENLYEKNEKLKKELSAERCRAALLASKAEMMQTTIAHLKAMDVMETGDEPPTTTFDGATLQSTVKFTGNFSDYFANLAEKV